MLVFIDCPKKWYTSYNKLILFQLIIQVVDYGDEPALRPVKNLQKLKRTQKKLDQHILERISSKEII